MEDVQLVSSELSPVFLPSVFMFPFFSPLLLGGFFFFGHRSFLPSVGTAAKSLEVASQVFPGNADSAVTQHHIGGV